MLKTLVFVKRKPGTTREAFRAHYEGTHAPLALKHMVGLERYVRNYTVASPGRPEPEWDCVTEMWFTDLEALQATAAWMQTEEGQVIARDELLFMDRPAMTSLMVEEVGTDRMEGGIA